MGCSLWGHKELMLLNCGVGEVIDAHDLVSGQQFVHGRSFAAFFKLQ